MKFSIKDFFSKCDQIRKKLRIWSHLLKKSLMENFIFCAVIYVNCFNQVRFLTVVPPFGPFWSVKYLNFGQKLLIWTAHYTFLESRHPGATKNLYVLFPEGNQKRYQLMKHYHHFFEQQRRNDTLNLLTP